MDNIIDNYNSVARFSDIEILRYHVSDFETLPLEHKILIFHLSQAALSGRDIIFDQNFSFNLRIRNLLESVYTLYSGDKSTKEFKDFEEYLFRVWFSSGIHHHYSNKKFKPSFPRNFLLDMIKQIQNKGQLPAFTPREITPLLDVIFDPSIAPNKTEQSGNADLLQSSCVNFYDHSITQKEAEEFYNYQRLHPQPETKDTPSSYGLNSRLEKDENENLFERTYQIGGLYSKALSRITVHLGQALHYCQTEEQSRAMKSLIDYYNTGDLQLYNDYCISWLRDTVSTVDYINGFTETYSDPIGLKGSWEGLVHIRDIEATERTQKISQNAQWFEDHAPIDHRFKKENAVGVIAHAVNVVMLAGDSYPATPIGINLPNADWIRAAYGSKSITIENIQQAYNIASQNNGLLEAFVTDADMISKIKQYGPITDRLHTDLHECLGHGSGKLLDDTSPDSLGQHGSTLEEARADLFALYFIADPKILEIDLLDDPEAYKACYYQYILNGLILQLCRIKPGEKLEEAHMKNRALIARYILHKGTLAGYLKLENTSLTISNYGGIRGIIAELLAEVQRIKSEGDFDAAGKLIEKYAIDVDKKLHKQVLDKYEKLNIAPYKGFVNPRLTPVYDTVGNIIDITISYGERYAEQMLRYSRDYSYMSLNPTLSARIKEDKHISKRTLDIANELRKKLRISMDGVVSTMMREKGLSYGINFGLTREYITKLAATLPHDLELARYLWHRDVRELKIIATMIFPDDKLFYEEATEMAVTASQHVELREQLTMNLLSRCKESPLWAAAWLLSKGDPHLNENKREKLSMVALILLARMARKGLSLNHILLKKLLFRTYDIMLDLHKPSTTDFTDARQQAAVLFLKRIACTGDLEESMVKELIKELGSSSNPIEKEFYDDIMFDIEFNTKD
ncbi:dipeptidyl-peptidase 3 family protein [Porphyromonas pogonae]|uniref:dipeptidyl-peptidase 3 family protein n=1 Tax=Porphyromonas pogonae TaxID=867595 RepID=UPI002E79CDC4|nr:peptidase M49 [Porphyromonas pogonae]